MAVNTDIAALWLEGLAARGVSVTIRNNRLCLHPARAYKELTDAEVLTLRHHRAEIKDVVNAGTQFDVVRPAPSAEPPHTAPAPRPETPRCTYCSQSPAACATLLTDRPDVFYALHPEAREARAGERRTREMHAYFGIRGDV